MTGEAKSALVRSRWKFRETKLAPAFLEQLGIEFRRVPDQDFWKANKHLLSSIYEEMQVESRNRMRELHPDTGGDGHEFGKFVSCYRKIKRDFQRYGATSVIVPVNPEIISVRKGDGRGGTKGMKAFDPDAFRDPTRAIQAMKLMMQGLSNRAVGRAIGCSHGNHRYILKVRLAMPKEVKCECGRVSNHRGWCKSRGLPKAFTGNGHLHSDATKAKMSQSHRIRWSKRKYKDLMAT